MLTVEQLNRSLYNSRNKVEYLLNLLTYLNSLFAISLLIYQYGFHLTLEAISRIYTLLNGVVILFIIIYLIRLLYAFQRKAFLLYTLPKTVLLLLLLINGFAPFFFNESILFSLAQVFGFNNYLAFYQLTSSLCIVLLVGIEISAVNIRISTTRLKPTVTFISSFLLVISLGTGFLMLPAMTNTAQSMPFLEALFTATSATCVTGLMVVDQATYLTFKGHLVILCLIQIGGIGMVTFATFVTIFLRQTVGIKHQSNMQDLLSTESLLSAQGLLRQIIFLTLLIETVGSIVLFFCWGDSVHFDSLTQKVFFSIFHSVSAFCSAGFSLYTNGLYELPVQKAYILHLVIALLMILGSLGFSSLMDLFSITSLRERLEKPWKDWKLNTKIAVYTTIVFIIFGTAGFYFLERNNALAPLNGVEAIIASFFQSATRTTGFNTVDITRLSDPTLIMLMFLMFVGASPGSTGGGIKTTTFFVIAVSVISSIRGKRVITFGKRTIPTPLLFRAYTVITFAAAYNLIATFVLSVSEPDLAILNVFFEQVSAFATVGLTTGITPQLSTVGKVVLMISMFLGRIGTLTLALAISRQVISNAYRYPNAHVMVG
ncbi:ATPase [Rhodocytophaga rosea]|uniref:ATPase n=1 Tax=Rhodocytophaga rosea TaxID=2704465 RepID=A0A6C0GH28_9BACT|nr:potassium transporter TrkG [Rhodocytophaga rosea]QHT67326.1 ATPase [Rhodocytophaga rosea]QHT70767.1 ATPase [Rhodocytophaga rosea]